MISGEATVVEEDGEHALGPGDAACWPAGAANAHQVVNSSDAACTYLILGSRTVENVARSPRTLIDPRPIEVVDGSGVLETTTDPGSLGPGSKPGLASRMRTGGELAGALYVRPARVDQAASLPGASQAGGEAAPG